MEPVQWFGDDVAVVPILTARRGAALAPPIAVRVDPGDSPNLGLTYVLFDVYAAACTAQDWKGMGLTVPQSAGVLPAAGSLDAHMSNRLPAGV